MKNNKTKLKIIGSILMVAIIVLIAVVFLRKRGKENTSYVEIDTVSTELQVEYATEELTGEWSEYTAKITLDDSKVTIEGNGVTSSGNSITIKSAGTYFVTGSLTDGNILIDASKNDDVQLVLDNCNIKSNNTAPINGIEANKLTIILAENSENTLEDGATYTEFTDSESQEPDGTLFTKTDLVINGSGKLTVNANYKDGIVSKDELKIINSNIEINSADDGIRGKDYVAINKANIQINSKGDGIKSTNNEEAELGYIAIEDGIISINSEADGIQAETILNISSNAQIDIITRGEIISSSQDMEFEGPGGEKGGGFGGGFQQPKQELNETSSENSQSSKGLKAGTEITIENGNIEINSTDDSIHSNGIIIINNGEIKTSSEDDGIHADTNIVINNGNIEIAKSYEGIESSYVEVNGGIISIIASDDAINIAGGNDSSAMGDRMGQNKFSIVGDSKQKLIINGGIITANADGDGLDSNGAIYINGGSVIVAGPTSSGNGALDYTTECVVAGGDIIIYGAVGMWQNPSNSSTQYCLTFRASGSSGDVLVLKDSKGNEIVSFESVKSYGAITISNSKIEKGETYTLYVGGSSIQSLTASSTVTSEMVSNGIGGVMQPGKGQR